MIFSVQNNKGGNSKSTTATSLASIISEKGKVLLVDTDPQGNCSVIYGHDPDQFQYTLYDVLLNNYPVKEAIRPLAKNIDILPSNSDLDFFDMDVISEPKKFPNPYSLLDNAIQSVVADYDFIVIDTPSYMGLMIINVLVATEKVIIPFVPDALSFKGVVKLVRKINEYKNKLNTSLEIAGIFPVIVERRTNVHKAVMEEVEKFCVEEKMNYINVEIPKTIAYSSEVAYNARPAVDSDKKIRQKYIDIFKHL